MIIKDRFKQIEKSLDKLINEMASKRTKQTCTHLLKARQAFGNAILEINCECPSRMDENEWN